MSLILYGAPLSPFVRKVDVFLREKGVDFENESVNIMPMPDWFKEISPARRIPVLRDTSVGAEGTAGTIPDSSSTPRGHVTTIESNYAHKLVAMRSAASLFGSGET